MRFARTHIVPTQFWHKLPGGRIQCDVCPRFCRLGEGQRGFCFVRERRADQIVLTTYGRSSGLAVDPIEKKPLYHFLPGTAVLSFGTAGCNLNCQFCQNWNISKSRQLQILSDQAFPLDVARFAKKKKIPSVAFTYNDPIVFMEYAVDVADACREEGIKSVAVTNGYMCAGAREEFFKHMDAANIDLKSFREEFYKRVCGGRLAAVLETLEYVKRETATWLEITTLLIPGENDSEAEIHGLSSWVMDKLGADVPLHFSAFHPDWKFSHKPATSPEILFRARDIALRTGLRHVYTGNIRDGEGSTTYCAACKAPLIERHGFRVGAVRLGAGARCPRCHAVCSGIF